MNFEPTDDFVGALVLMTGAALVLTIVCAVGVFAWSVFSTWRERRRIERDYE